MGMKNEIYARMETLYREWNARINVVSRKDIDHLHAHHILHSLSIAEYLRSVRPEVYAAWRDGGVRVLDLGTGGGFPGIPLAVEFPDVRFTLVDSVGKKIKVASSVAADLGLKNVRCINARAESLTERYDWVVSRAVAPLDVLWGWSSKLYGRGLICLKGGDVHPEIAEYLRKSRREASSVRVWEVQNWLPEEYFAGKFVIEI
ncbi:MAG: 16S rRNA (guanine(527)-N(7))-methyltransferase RsmG [Bacteroidales bacterium]|nr:16S rRNA (guanine(527)-N(7))-methyltransferase RsmG [Bacteroidales bacterium]